MLSLEDFLSHHQLMFERHEHPAVMTVEESTRLVPTLPGGKTKNLFLRDKKATRHFLVTVEAHKAVDLLRLSDVLECSRLSFGSPDRLMAHLGVTPGSVSLLTLYRDTEQRVEFVIDQCLWDDDAVQAHPMINTATMVVPHAGLEQFLAITCHEPIVLDVPQISTDSMASSL